MITICSHCFAEHEVSEEYEGHKAECSQCGKGFTVTSSEIRRSRGKKTGNVQSNSEVNVEVRPTANSTRQKKKKKSKAPLLAALTGLGIAVAGGFFLLKPSSAFADLSANDEAGAALQAPVPKQESPEKVAAKNNGYDLLADKSKTYTDGKDGFLIVTTNELKAKVKNLPAYVYTKHHVRDFRVFMATEDDFKGSSPVAKKVQETAQENLDKLKKKFEGEGDPKNPREKRNRDRLLSRHEAELLGKGRVAGLDILQYLKDNYEKLGLKYVIFIGNPNPDNGTIPMLYSDPYHTPTDYAYTALKYNWIESLESQQKRKRWVDEAKPSLGLLKSFRDHENTHFPQVFVGRVPNYGEKSAYGRVADTEAILDRFIRYDTEKDINYRYSMLVDRSFGNPEFEKLGFNYHLIDRWKWPKNYGMPALGSPDGKGRHISNFQKLQDYSTVTMGAYSHGGPWGMEGLKSNYVKYAHDKYPSVITLGACSVGDVWQPENLTYTLLRFQSIAASGGTISVSKYNGNWDYVRKNKLGKGELIKAGKTVGEAHWLWYGHLARGADEQKYPNKHKVAATNLAINLYGDPSALPLPGGIKNIPYPFISRPVVGYFQQAEDKASFAKISESINLENNKDSETVVTLSVDSPWVKLSKNKVTLKPNEKKSVKVTVESKDFDSLDLLYNEARIKLSSKTKEGNDYSCIRRFVVKKNFKGYHVFQTFSENRSKDKNYSQLLTDRVTGLKFSHNTVRLNGGVKFDAKKLAEGKFAGGLDTRISQSAQLNGFEGQNFAVNFQIKFSGEKTVHRLGDTHTIFDMKDCLAIVKSPKKLKLMMANADPDNSQVERFEKEVDFTWTEGKWYQFTVNVNSAKGVAKLYVGKSLKITLPIKKDATYSAKNAYFPASESVIDTFVVKGDLFTPKEIAGFWTGRYFVGAYPNDTQTVGLGRTVFNFDTGSDKKQLSIKLDAYAGSKQEIKANDKGQFTLPNLKSNTKYQWHVVDENGKAISENFAFETVERIKQVKHTNDLAGKVGAWFGDAKIIDIHRTKFLTGKTLYLPIEEVSPLKEYNFHYQALHKPRTSIMRGFYVKDDKGGFISVSESKLFNGRHYRWDAPSHIKIQFGKTTIYNGKMLYAGLKIVDSDNVALRSFDITRGDLTNVNLAPELLIPKDKLKYEYPTGTNGYHKTLAELVQDPDGDVLEYTLLSGPRWVYIQNNESLFSNFGPPASDVGKDFECKIKARDPKGNSITFTVVIKAVAK